MTSPRFEALQAAWGRLHLLGEFVHVGDAHRCQGIQARTPRHTNPRSAAHPFGLQVAPRCVPSPPGSRRRASDPSGPRRVCLHSHQCRSWCSTFLRLLRLMEQPLKRELRRGGEGGPDETTERGLQRFRLRGVTQSVADGVAADRRWEPCRRAGAGGAGQDVGGVAASAPGDRSGVRTPCTRAAAYRQGPSRIA